MSRGRTSLTRFAHLMAEPDPNGATKAAREAWVHHGIVVLFPEQLKKMDGLERQLIHAIADKKYGKRA
ncbi:hypothetical protein [Novosphingobium sp.]|uniref:hypothetical protein n=1 Tax=Novosphingobium sp. TaxID=1874826 RepID=UPI002FDED68D